MCNSESMKDTMRKIAHAGIKSWKQLNKTMMGPLMKSEGGHGPAMKKMGKIWREEMPRKAHGKKRK